MSLLNLFADITRAHADLKGYDRAQVAWPEVFQCLNCGHEGALSVHGLCMRCDSGAVQPITVIEAR